MHIVHLQCKAVTWSQIFGRVDRLHTCGFPCVKSFDCRTAIFESSMLSSASSIFTMTILVVQLPTLTTPFSKGSLSQPSFLNYTSTASSPQPVDSYCYGSVSWRGSPDFDWRFRASCDNAAKMLWTREVNQHTNIEYEFLDYRTPPIHDNPLMRTPRRYSYRESRISC